MPDGGDVVGARHLVTVAHVPGDVAEHGCGGDPDGPGLRRDRGVVEFAGDREPASDPDELITGGGELRVGGVNVMVAGPDLEFDKIDQRWPCPRRRRGILTRG